MSYKTNNFVYARPAKNRTTHRTSPSKSLITFDDYAAIAGNAGERMERQLLQLNAALKPADPLERMCVDAMAHTQIQIDIAREYEEHLTAALKHEEEDPILIAGMRRLQENRRIQTHFELLYEFWQDQLTAHRESWQNRVKEAVKALRLATDTIQ